MEKLHIKKFSELDDDLLNKIIDVHYNHWVKFNPKLNRENVVFKFKNLYTKKSLPFGVALFNELNLIGFCTFKIENLVKYPQFYPWISDVMILEEFRNKGYGKELIKYAEEIIREEGFLTLYVWTDQVPDFYKKQGFKYIQEIEKNEGGSGLLFSKELK